MYTTQEIAWSAYREVSKLLPPELQSPQSDLHAPRISSEAFWGAEGAISLILYLASIGLNPIQEEDVRNFFERKAARRRYEGKWDLVHQLVDEETFAPIRLYEIVLRAEGPHAFFGNRIHGICRAGRVLKWDPIRTTERRRAKPTQRKRGYDDKGTLGKIKVDPPIKEPSPSPREYRSTHTLFFSSLPRYLHRFLSLSRKMGIDPTLQDQEEEYKKIREEVDYFIRSIAQMRKTPVPKDRKNLRSLRKKCKKLAAIAARVSEWQQKISSSEPGSSEYSHSEEYCLSTSLSEKSVERSDAQTGKEPWVPAHSADAESRSAISTILPAAWQSSLQSFPELLEYFGFFDLVPPATDQRS